MGILSLMVFLVIIFAIMLYEVEKGKHCFVGDEGCIITVDTTLGVRNGDRVLVNKDNKLSQFPDVFAGLWFCFVTLTTTG